MTRLDPFLPPGSTAEDCDATDVEFIRSRLKVDVRIIEAYRLGTPHKDGTPSPLRIRFGNMEDKLKVQRNCYQLKGTKISVQEDAPLEVRTARRKTSQPSTINQNQTMGDYA